MPLSEVGSLDFSCSEFMEAAVGVAGLVLRADALPTRAAPSEEGEAGRVVSLMLNQKLCFETFITNVGTVPIRTHGPWPGQEYLFSQN